jgi:hypothetical protein
MNLSFGHFPSRQVRFLFHGLLVVLAGLLPIAAGVPLLAQGTKLWTQSRFDEFEKGTPQGVEITSDGKLRIGPSARELLTTPSSFVWSVAVSNGKSDAVFLGTASPATVLRVSKDANGKWISKKIFETKAVAVQVVRVGPDGAVYAATISDGKVYRLKADTDKAVDESSAEVVFDLSKVDGSAGDGTAGSGADGAKTDAGDKKADAKSHYIWDMTFDSAGRLYVATGGPAAVYRLDVKQAQPKAELFFKSDEQHIRALTWDKSGNLIAGSDGSGLVYRIDSNGKGYVLFSAPRREVTAVAVGSDGTIFAADVGDKSKNPLPPLPIAAGNSSITISFVQPGSVSVANASASLPDGTEIYALTANAAPKKLWSSKDDIVYQLAVNSDGTGGGVTAFTGNRGRVLSIHGDGSYSDIAHLDAQQAVAVASLPGKQSGWLVGSANTGKLFELESPAATSSKDLHSYASDVLDAGALARWGRMETDPESHGFTLLTRSGNVEQPVRSAKDWGWSDWQPVVNDKIASPPGRYIQWKVELSGSGVVSGVGLNFLPVNSAPVVDEVLVVPGARVTPQPAQTQPASVTISFPQPAQAVVSFDPNANAAPPIQAQKDRTAVTARWNAHDDDGDDLTYDLYLRGDGEHVWLPLKSGLTEKVYSFDGANFPDGGYTIKVVVSDAPSHSPGDALTGELVSERFELDTTPPVITGLKAGVAVATECKQSPCEKGMSIPVSFEATDATSPISHAEYSVDAGAWQYIDPVGQLSDAKTERYSVLVPLPADAPGKAGAEHLITVRAYDRHENVATAKVLVAGGKSGDR